MSLFFYTEFLKKTLTYNGLKEINEIRKYINKFPLNSSKKDQISFSFTLYDVTTIGVFLLTLFFAFFWLQFNLNIFSLLIIECTLIYISLVYSSIRLAPKKMMNIIYKNLSIPDNDVFILSETKDYYTILFDNDRVEFIMKDTISQIVPNPKYDKIQDFKIENPLDEIKEAFSLKNILTIIGFALAISVLLIFLGASVFLFIRILNPNVQFLIVLLFNNHRHIRSKIPSGNMLRI